MHAAHGPSGDGEQESARRLDLGSKGTFCFVEIRSTSRLPPHNPNPSLIASTRDF